MILLSTRASQKLSASRFARSLRTQWGSSGCISGVEGHRVPVATMFRTLKDMMGSGKQSVRYRCVSELSVMGVAIFLFVSLLAEGQVVYSGYQNRVGLGSSGTLMDPNLVDREQAAQTEEQVSTYPTRDPPDLQLQPTGPLSGANQSPANPPPPAAAAPPANPPATTASTTPAPGESRDDRDRREREEREDRDSASTAAVGCRRVARFNDASGATTDCETGRVIGTGVDRGYDMYKTFEGQIVDMENSSDRTRVQMNATSTQQDIVNAQRGNLTRSAEAKERQAGIAGGVAGAHLGIGIAYFAKQAGVTAAVTTKANACKAMESANPQDTAALNLCRSELRRITRLANAAKSELKERGAESFMNSSIKGAEAAMSAVMAGQFRNQAGQLANVTPGTPEGPDGGVTTTTTNTGGTGPANIDRGGGGQTFGSRDQNSSGATADNTDAPVVSEEDFQPGGPNVTADNKITGAPPVGGLQPGSGGGGGDGGGGRAGGASGTGRFAENEGAGGQGSAATGNSKDGKFANMNEGGAPARGGLGGGSGGGVGVDSLGLDKMLENLFGKKDSPEEEAAKQAAAEEEARRKAARAPADEGSSLLGRNVNIFLRVSDVYKRKEKDRVF